MHLVDSGGYGVALLIIGVRGENTHLAARLLLGIDRFGYLTCILVDQAIGGVHDILGGTVIPFQLEDTATGIKILELQDIIYISASEGIDALGVIPYHADMAVSLAKPLHDQVLGEVRILILIHQYIPEEVPVFLQDGRMIPEQDIGLQQQVVEVHRSRLEATVLVTFIDFPEQGNLGIHIAFHELFILLVGRISYQGVLRVGDPALHHS